MRNTRDRLIAESEPFLEPDEAVAHVIRALEGPNKWVALGLATAVAFGISLLLRGAVIVAIPALWLVYTRLYARRLILATDRRLAVLAGGRFRFTPRRLIDSLDLETRIGKPKGLWLQIQLGRRKLYLVPRSIPEAAAADADLDD